MIPFARISTYGNIVKTTIKKITSSVDGSVFLLSSSGNLYGRGLNRQGELGTGNDTAINSWQVLYTNVKDVFTGSRGTFIITNDGKVMYGGRDSILRDNQSTFLSWTDYTSYSIYGNYKVSDIISISATLSSCFMLMGDHTLHSYGRNSYGETGDNKAINQFTPIRKVADNVSSIKCSSGSSGYIGLDGNFYRSGSNSNYQLGTNDTSNVTTWRLYGSCNDFQFSADSTLLLIFNISSSSYKIFNAGTNSLYQLGVGGTNTSLQRKVFTEVTQVAPANLHINSLKNNGLLSRSENILSYNNKLFSCGDNSYGALGNNTKTNVASYSNVSIGIPSDVNFANDDDYIISCGSWCTFIYHNKKLYATGTNTAFNLNSTTYVEVDLPII